MARILLIDDEPGLLSVLDQALSDASHQVTAVGDANSVTEALVSVDFDLVVTDINMPGTDGVEVLTYLRTHHPDIPVIAMSGGGDLPPSFLLKIASRLGAVHALQKPFSIQQLLDAVEQAFGRARCEPGSDPDLPTAPPA